jgi:hypothetical protein
MTKRIGFAKKKKKIGRPFSSQKVIVYKFLVLVLLRFFFYFEK